MKKDSVKELRLKRDEISGRVLSVGEGFIEIEGFGRVNTNQDLKIFAGYDNYSTLNRESVVVGDENLRFIVADKEICGIIVDKEPEAENIRVLLMTTGFKGYFHNNVEICSDVDYDMFYYVKNSEDKFEEKVVNFKAGEVKKLSDFQELYDGKRVKFKTQDPNGKIRINTILRNNINPEYRGSIEISEGENGFLIVNDLSLEEYLYGVVPSEMPVSYGVEALKVQAVCARSYAVSHMNDSSLVCYGAQVDDSTNYQVYNNTPEREESISAVKSTYGKVLKHNGQVANTYFFSTSCGSTTDSTVWGGEKNDYIKEKYLSNDEIKYNLLDNKEFSEFIKSKPDTFDSRSPWYRWEIKLGTKEMSDKVNNGLSEVYNLDPKRVLKYENGQYVQKKVTNVGNVENVIVEKRGPGGIVEELIIVGDKNTVKIIKQSFIRKIISPNGNDIIKQDGSVVSNMNMLPSAFFTIEKNKDEYHIYGGGYGHGAGMSQNAVKQMVDSGMNYEEILKFFYTDVELCFVYGNQ